MDRVSKAMSQCFAIARTRTLLEAAEALEREAQGLHLLRPVSLADDGPGPDAQIRTLMTAKPTFQLREHDNRCQLGELPDSEPSDQAGAIESTIMW